MYLLSSIAVSPHLILIKSTSVLIYINYKLDWAAFIIGEEMETILCFNFTAVLYKEFKKCDMVAINLRIIKLQN